ncbi:MAG: formylglycine-generating enzyme family protein [Muribaculaceae bacterium]|nr:formylglycine-generating enzyme family protein [Muribaculaceae bacterium]
MKHSLVYDVNGIKFEMVEVEGGTFMMGATEEQGEDVTRFELPVHQVTLSDFSICKTVVTQALWEAVMGKDQNESPMKGDKYPIVFVTWENAQAFISKLNKLTGATFRLPTEAEWEFAARGGKKSKGYMYAGSNNVDEVAWYKLNSNNELKNVATKLPNELGLYDMSGDVWEWCEDWFAGYKEADLVDPHGPSASPVSTRAIRGGEISDDATCCRIAYRKSYYPGSRSATIGFRLAQ